MKKTLLGVLLTLAVCGALPAAVRAVETGSLLYQGSFGLYYQEDPFDLTLNPAFLHRIDRWRLFTNLSSYDETDSLLLGTSGRLGPGSLGLFYETDRRAWEDERARATDRTTDVSGWTGSGRNDVLVTSESNTSRYEEESGRHALVATYGADFGGFSLGVAYRPSFSSGSVTLRGGLAESPDYGTDPLSWSRPSFAEGLMPGWNYAEAWRNTRYDAGGRILEDTARSESFAGEADTDEDRHGLEVGSELRLFPRVPIWVRLGVQSVQRSVEGEGAYTSAWSATSQVTGGDPYAISESQTSTWSGDPVGGLGTDAFDGTAWSLDVVPRYAVSPSVTLECGLRYDASAGDVTGRWTQDVLVARTQRETVTQTWEGSQHFVNAFSGDGESSAYAIAPRVYLTYGAVEFAVGAGYSRAEDEVSGSQQSEGTLSWAYDDGASAANDWTYAGTSTARSERSFTTTTTALSFPVATKFRVTDRLELRAGARHVRTTAEARSRSSEREDERFTVTDGAGSVVRQGPATRGREESARTESTTSETCYRLGAGYRPTDHLQFDLLFSQTTGDGVDTTEVHVAAVFAF